MKIGWASINDSLCYYGQRNTEQYIHVFLRSSKTFRVIQNLYTAVTKKNTYFTEARIGS